MSTNSVLYEEKNELLAIYQHPQSEDRLDYLYTITITNSVKNPIEIKMVFNGDLPSYAPMPLKEYSIKAMTLIELHLKLIKWFKKYGYILRGVIEP